MTDEAAKFRFRNALLSLELPFSPSICSEHRENLSQTSLWIGLQLSCCSARKLRKASGAGQQN